MAWVTMYTGSNNLWQYDNACTISDTWPDSVGCKHSTISGGIRTYTAYGTGKVTKVYIKTRMTGETVERGELSKTYYDGQV